MWSANQYEFNLIFEDLRLSVNVYWKYFTQFKFKSVHSDTRENVCLFNVLDWLILNAIVLMI